MPTRRRFSSLPAPLTSLRPGLSSLGLERLPDLVQASVASFLGASDLNALACSTRWLRDSTSLCPPSRRLLWRAESLEAPYGSCLWWMGRSAFVSLLSRHGGAVPALELADALLMDLFCEALRLGSGRRVRSLTIGSEWLELNGVFKSMKADAGRLLATAVESASLPLLEELRLRDGGDTDWTPVLRVVGMGGCPALRVLDIDLCNKMLFRALKEGVVMGEREGFYGQLRELRFNADFSECCEGLCEELGSLLACGQFGGLEVLELSSSPEDSFLTEAGVAAVGSFLMETCGPALKKLTLGCLDDCSGDGIALVLASGAAPGLENLTLHNIVLDAAAARVLGDAVRSSGVLRGLQRLEITSDYDVEPGPTDLSDLMAGAARSHGFPGLSVLKLSGMMHAATAVSLALEGPHGLPALRCLGVESMDVEGLRRLGQALQKRSLTVKSLEQLTLAYSSPHSQVLPQMGRAGVEALLGMLRSPSLLALKDLDISGCKLTGAAVRRLANVLGQRRCCEELESLKLFTTRVGAATLSALLDAVAAGACPVLKALDLGSIGQTGLGEVEPLAALLDGRRPICLKELYLRTIPLDASYAASSLARAFSLEGSARLESLALCFKFGSSGLAGALDLVKALQGLAGDQLRMLWLKLEGVSRKRAEAVGEMVADAIERGAMPRLEDATVGMSSRATGLWTAISFSRIERLLQERRQRKAPRPW